MAYASPAERLALRASTRDFPLDFVVQIRKNGRESELICDDVDHAMELSEAWADRHGADYVEIFRVLADGTLNPTLGPTVGTR